MGKGLAHRPDDLPVIEISSDFHLQGVPQRCPTYKPHTHTNARTRDDNDDNHF